MERFQTPGLAIGVVKNGELVYAKGYGVREIGRPEAVESCGGESKLAARARVIPTRTALSCRPVGSG